MVETLDETDVDIVLGSRFLGEVNGASLLRRTVLRTAVQFTNVTSGVKLTDAHNGLRAFNRHVADTMRITSPDMTHASEIIEIIARNGYRYVEVAVTIDYTEYSMTKGQSVRQRRQHRLRHPAPQGEQPMILVQILLIVAAVSLAVIGLRSRTSSRGQRVEEAVVHRA